MSFDSVVNVDLLSNLLEYNHERFLAYSKGLSFIPNPEFERLLSARHQKLHRVRRRFIFLASRFKFIWFCTFTFSNDYINKSERTKRDLIKSVINSHDFKYMLNIDYGEKNHRQHFHCILATNLDMDINQYFQSYYRGGYSYSSPCSISSLDFTRLSLYFHKLTNHCTKSTTSRFRMVYNFSGYKSLYPSTREQSNAYFLDCLKLFGSNFYSSVSSDFDTPT